MLDFVFIENNDLHFGAFCKRLSKHFYGLAHVSDYATHGQVPDEAVFAKFLKEKLQVFWVVHSTVGKVNSGNLLVFHKNVLDNFRL